MTMAPTPPRNRMMTDGMILVAGMHRSGTSALAGAMVQLGVAPPQDLMAADEANIKGYFEPLSAVDHGDAFLARFGRTWRDFREIPDCWFAEAGPTIDAFADVLSRSFPPTGLRVLKDPRLSVLLPLWDAALARLQVDAVYVIPLRPPRDVVASLLRRDPMRLVEAEALWVRYILNVERHTRGRRRAFVESSALVSDPVTTLCRLEETLNLTFPHRPDDSEAVLRTFLETDLMRSAQSGVSPLSNFADSIYRTCQALVRDPHDPSAMDKLDVMSAAFDHVCEPIAHLVLLESDEESRAAVIANLRRRIEHAADDRAPGAFAALQVISQLPDLYRDGTLRALVADVDHLVDELVELHSTPLSSAMRLLSYKALQHFKPLSYLMSARRRARFRRSLDKRHPFRYIEVWSRLRDRLLETSTPTQKTGAGTARAQPDMPPLAVAVHAFYHDGLDEILLRFGSVDKAAAAFYVTCPPGKAAITRHICAAHGIDATIREVENRGRDVLPLFTILPDIIAGGHEVILKLHTKKSLHQANGNAWRAALLSELIDPERIDAACDAFHRNPTLGIVAPRGHVLDLAAFIETCGPKVEALARQNNIPRQALKGAYFVAGTMMFLRTSLLQDLARTVDAASFEPEAGQTEGTYAHAIERIFAVHAAARGYQTWTTGMQPVQQGARHYRYVMESPIFRHTRMAVSSAD